ncbi:MAG: imidazole glycerol phosphate synthase subunit HisH, partial [Alphaproteobacteria bacterium]|nr:imidazole glycerol phosphate synthase subunit HisH [Alphaproteobacteria bacterium]
MKLVIVDYGSGNLRSVENAMRAATTFAQRPHEIVISSDPVEVGKADYLVLPGVGAFADCRAGLDAIDGMIDAINHLAWELRRPFLGICVGMQLMAEAGEEGGQTTPGLGWI